MASSEDVLLFSFADFFKKLLKRALLIGLLREDPPLPASYWTTGDNSVSGGRMRSKQRKDLFLVGWWVGLEASDWPVT